MTYKIFAFFYKFGQFPDTFTIFLPISLALFILLYTFADRNLKHSSNMNTPKNTSFHSSIYIAGVLIIINHLIRLFTNIISLIYFFNPAILYNTCISLLIIGTIVAILLEKKYGLYAFFTLQLLNAIILTVWLGDAPVHFFVALLYSAAAAAFLCLKKDGVSGWDIILSRKTQTEEPIIQEKQEIITAEAMEIPTFAELPSKTTSKKAPSSKTFSPKNLIYVFLTVSVIAVAFAGIIFLRLNTDKQAPNLHEMPKDTATKETVIGKYVYLDGRNVLHTKIDCKAVFKDHNMQQVNPIDPVCLSFESLNRVCSRCVSNQAVDSLNILFEKYRQSYVNVGDLHKDLDSRYSDIPSELRFRENMRDRATARSLYDFLIEQGEDLGTFDEFTQWIGLSKPAKKKLIW